MKKLFSVIVALFLGFTLFAQTVPSTGLTDKDVKNFAKNYPTLVKQMEKYEKIEDYSSLAALAAYGDVEAILEKVGISGPNRCEKLSMICYCLGVAIAEQEIDEETLALMKMYGMEDPTASIRALINDKDYKIVKANFDILVKALDIDLDD